MKQYFFACICLLCSFLSKATTGSFTVGGDIDKYYPVTFFDANWWSNRATKFEIGRSTVHTDSDWRGAMIASFEYHCNQWGNGAEYINASINIKGGTVEKFVAGWADITYVNAVGRIVI